MDFWQVEMTLNKKLLLPWNFFENLFLEEIQYILL